MKIFRQLISSFLIFVILMFQGMVYPIIPLITPAYALTGQTITFNALSNKTYGDADFSVSATASSGLAVSFSSQTAGVCTVAGSTVHIVSAGTCTVRASQAGDGTYDPALDVDQPFTVNPLAITGSFTANNKVYDGDTTAVVATRSLSGVINSDDASLTGGTATFDTKNIGTGKTVTLSGASITGAQTSNYSLSSVSTTTADVTARPITVTATTNTKVYDGDTTASALPTLTSGTLAAGETATYSETYDTKNVGTGKTLTPLAVIRDSGNAVVTGNYNVSYVNDATGVITARDLTVTATGVNRQYDSTTNATVTLSTDKVSSDTVTTSYTSASFADKNIGTGKTVTITGISIGGADATNYNLLTPPTTTTANITTYTLTANATVSNKVYDQTTAATITGRSLVGVIGSDVVSISGGTAVFNNKNVGTGKAVSITGMTLSGADSGNYAYDGTASTTADVTALNLTVSGTTASNKVYDGATTATLNFGSASLVGVISGDTVTINSASATGAFPDKNVGTGRTVTVSGLALSGADAGNYTVSQPTTTADITAKTLTVSGITASNKTYNRATSATLNTGSAALVGVVGGDTVNLSTGSAAGTFSDFNVGTSKTVTVSGLSISGTDSGNYSLTQPTTTADITQKALTITADNRSKTYGDVLTLGTTAFSQSGLVSGDSITGVTLTSTGSGELGIASVTTYPIVPSAATGSGLTNYSISYVNGTLTVVQRTLTITANSQTKIYGDSDPIFTYTDDRVNSDAISGALARAAGENVGVYNILVGTLDAGSNYVINFVSNTLSIVARTLNLTVAGINKTYDGGTTASVSFSTDALLADTNNLSIGGTASFADKNVGVGETVSVSAIGISGSAASNYTLASTTASTLANITTKALTISATGVNKVYDGLTSATVNLSDDRVSGDTLSTSYTTASFADANVGVGKTVSVSGISISGTDSGNYTFNTSASTLANVTQASLTVTADDKSKEYDGSGFSSFTASYNGFVNNETSSVLGGSLTFGGAATTGVNVGTYTITASGLTSSNYSISYVNGTLSIVDTIAPVANSDSGLSNSSLVATKNTPLTIADSVLLANDTDANHSSNSHLTVTAVSSTATPSGTVSHSGTTTTFTPGTDFLGNTTFTYTISDGTNTATSSALVRVNPPISSGQVLLQSTQTVDPTTPQIVVGATSSDSTITIPSGVNNASLDLSNLLSGGTVSLTNAITLNATTSVGEVDIAIPSGVTVTGASSWNGVLNAPQIQSNTSVSAGGSSTNRSVIEVGANDTEITFSSPVRIFIADQGNIPVGFSRGGTFTEITNVCSSDSSAGIGSFNECKFPSGNNMVIWTKHFTKFVSYLTNAGAGPGGSGATYDPYSAPVCGETKPGGAPSFVSAVAGKNSVTLTWNEAPNPVTYYLITYGETSGAQTYGNANVGGKGTTSYTVNGLSGGTTYYFKIRAGNGCMPGSYSGEISATPGGSELSGPATGFAQGVLSVAAEKNGDVIEEVKASEENPQASEEVTQKPQSSNQNNGFLGGLVGAIIGFFTRLFGK